MYKSLVCFSITLFLFPMVSTAEVAIPVKEVANYIPGPSIENNAEFINTLTKKIVVGSLLEKKISSLSKELDVATINHYIGQEGTYNSEDQSYKVKSLRTDLRGIVGMNPNKLISSVTFKSEGYATKVEGSLIVTQNQINPMIDLLLKNNFIVTGLHDHIGNESPAILYLKFEGDGNDKDLAILVNKFFTLLKEGSKSESFPLAIMDQESTTLNTQLVDHLIGNKGEMKEGVYCLCGNKRHHSIAKANSDIKFSGSDELAIVEGDLLLNQDQLKKILPILSHSGISIMAINEKFPSKDDRVVQIHYYGVGKVASLARGIHKVLNLTD